MNIKRSILYELKTKELQHFELLNNLKHIDGSEIGKEMNQLEKDMLIERCKSNNSYFKITKLGTGYLKPEWVKWVFKHYMWTIGIILTIFGLVLLARNFVS